MGKLAFSEKSALLNLLITCIPLSIFAALLMVPKGSESYYSIAETGMRLMPYWLWVWIPSYLVATGFYARSCFKSVLPKII